MDRTGNVDWRKYVTNSDPPKILNAKVTLKPCLSTALGESGSHITLKTVDEFLNERYPGWETDSLNFFGGQIGMDQLFSLPPAQFFKLGVIYALMKENKI